MKRDFAVVLSAVLVAEWVAPLFPRDTRLLLERVLMAFGLGWVFISVRSVKPLSQLGVRVDNLLISLPALLAPVALTFGFYVVYKRSAVELPSLAAFGSYVLWALFQQILAVFIFWRHFRSRFALADGSPLFSRANAAVAGATAATFSAVHAPNPGLMLLTFVGELLFMTLFQRFRNLFAVSVAHAASALLASALWAPSPLLPNLIVGLRFLRP